MEKEEIRRLVLEEGLTVTNLLDVVIEENGIIGVGLVSLGEEIKNYIHSKI